MGTIFQDVLYGFRMLRKNWGLTIAVILTLAIGIGINSVIFSGINAVLLRPLPYENSDRLVMIWEKNPRANLQEGKVSYPDFLDWKRQSQYTRGMGIFSRWGFTLTGAAEPEYLRGALISADFFPVLGIKPALGRTFLSDEDRPGAGGNVILSYALWQRRFGANPNVIGQTLTLSDQNYTVIGVMPFDFEFLPLKGAELWAPIGVVAGKNILENRGYRVNNQVIARLKDGVTRQQAQAEIVGIASRLEQQFPDTNTGVSANVVDLHEQVVGNVRLGLLIILGAVTSVLLIACVNIANLLLARSSARKTEMAVRIALGASRGRIVRQLLTESVLLSLIGGALGLLIAVQGTYLLIAISPQSIPRLGEARLDLRVLAFTFGLSTLTGILFGLAPALQASKSDLNETLKSTNRSSTANRNRVRSLLVVSEVALALTLLVGAGLLLKSFLRLKDVEPGFDPKNILTMQIALPQTRYADEQQQVSFFQQLLQRIEAMPNVEAASVVNSLPLSGQGVGISFQIAGAPSATTADQMDCQYRVVSPKYFRTMSIPLLNGRDFTESDNLKAPGVAIINQAMARRYFPNESPVGKRIGFGGGPFWCEVIGVVGDVRHYKLNSEPEPEAYLSSFQDPWRYMTLVVRTTSQAPIIGAVRNEILAVDKDQPVYNIRSMEELLSESVAQPRFNLGLLTLFAVLAMALAVIGIYGMMGTEVTQRTQEIGLRMALGAQKRDVLRLVIRQGMTLVLIGVAAGLALAVALTRLMSSMLFGVSATDPMTLALITVLLAGVALLACYLPARRATKVDPLAALRYE
jgi:putative ABC transport system permease protein